MALAARVGEDKTETGGINIPVMTGLVPAIHILRPAIEIYLLITESK
jgi:hypothetical protein